MYRSVFFILLSLTAATWASNVLEHAYVDHMECSTSQEYCSNSSCKLSFKSRRVKQFTWTCNLIKTIDVVDVRVVMYYRYRAGYKQFLVDVTADYCAYHKNHFGSAVLELVSSTFKNHTKNIWQKCPYQPGNYAITNLPLTAALVKNIFLPAGDYKFTINVRVNDEKVESLSAIQLFVNIPAGMTIEDDKMG